MTAFDPNAYRKEVLKPLLDGGQHQIDDPFAVLGLDPSVDDETLIRERVGEVVAFWRKEQSSPRYKGLASALLKQSDALSAQLLDAGRRAEVRARVQGASATADAEAVAKVDELLDTLERRHGGIPRDRLERLRSLTASLGVTEAQIDARLAHRTILDDQAETVEPIPAGTRRQVAQLLAELARLDPEAGSHRTIYGFLGLPIGADRAAIEARREALDARNRQRRHDRLRTVIDELVALAETLLVKGDPRRYLAGIEEGVREAIAPAIETAVLLEDKVSAAETERLTREAVAAGLDPASARQVVIETARSLSAPIDVGTAPDYVVCAHCSAANTPEPGRADAECTRCDAELFRACPQCGRPSPRSDIRCGACRFDLRAFDEAAEDLAQAMVDIDAGHLVAARARLDTASAWSDDLPDLVRVRDRLAMAQRAADDAWSNLALAKDDGRVDDIRRYLASVEQIASDQTGPDGLTLDAVRARLAEADAEIEAAVTEALGAPDATAREIALVALLARYPGAPAVAAALAEVGVQPPSDVRIEPDGASLRVRWERSPSPGPVEYRVERRRERTGGASTTLGRLTATEISDAGAPPGEAVSYAVAAVRLGDISPSATSHTRVHTPEVDALTVIDHDGALELRWRPPPVGEVAVERVEQGAAGVPVTLRSGPNGLLDTGVRTGVTYEYRVRLTYPSVGGQPPVQTPGAVVSATAFALPEPPPAPAVVPQGRSITLKLPTPGDGVESVVLRAAAQPTIGPGTVLEAAGVRAAGGPLAGRDGTFFDSADGGARWYVPGYRVGSQTVIGPSVAHPGVGEIDGVRVDRDDQGPVVRWSWPPACTEAEVHWISGSGTVVPGTPGVSVARTTNTAYDIKGGWRPDGAPAGPVSVLVLAAGRIDGQRVPVPGWTDVSRATG